MEPLLADRRARLVQPRKHPTVRPAAAASRVVAIVPARAGSKGVRAKNVAVVGGRSLVARAVDACWASGAVDDVVVTTDGEEIAAEAAAAGASVIERPAELAGDRASSESALLHAIAELPGDPPTVVAFVQATSPFIDPEAFARAVGRVCAGEADVVFSAVATHELLWRGADAGTVVAVNHHADRRLRRQDRRPDWKETGAFYVMDAAGFVTVGHRFFGRIGIEPVDEMSALEIDTADQLELARVLATQRPECDGELGAVTLLVTDFDGVHTDDRVTLDQDGVESVTASRADGHGIEMLRRAGIPVLIVSSETNTVVARRAEKLGVDCLQGISEKWPRLQRWLGERGVEPASVAYIGNDVNDLACLRRVGYPIAVASAHPSVVEAARYVTARPGGHGAVREVADRIIAGRRLAGAFRGGA